MRRSTMKALFYEYPPCSTCKKARTYLSEHNIDFTAFHIVEETPTEKQLQEWIQRSSYDVKKFFNTSGNAYKEMQLKDKLPTMSEEEKIALLASNGMLIKRPLLVLEEDVIPGFKEVIYKEKLGI